MRVGMKKIMKLDTSEQWQASKRVSNLWKDLAFLPETDDLSTPQVPIFDIRILDVGVESHEVGCLWVHR